MSRTGAGPLPGTTVDPRYPDSNGRFMGDTAFHNDAVIELRTTLEDHFADMPDVYVTSNLVFYYQEGDPASNCDPDGLVAKGVGKHLRRSFRVWEEGKMPCVLFEMASEGTWRADIDEKPVLYASLGVKEYFVYDPEGCYLDPVLRGFKTVKGQPVPLKLAADGSLVSKELGLRLVPEGVMLRLIDLETGQPILTLAEQAEQHAQRAEEARRCAKAARPHAEEAQGGAEEARRRVDQLEAEVQRLRALLEERNRKE